MNKDTIVHVDLYDNPLTEKEGDYVGRVSINGSAHNAECAQRIIDKRSEYRLETILNIMDLVDQEKRALLAEGKSVIDGVGQFLPTISGSFDGPEAPFDAEKHKLSVSFTMGKALREALAQATVETREGSAGLVINSVFDPITNEMNGRIASYSNLVIKGDNIKIAGDNPSVGVFLTPSAGDAIQARAITHNMPSELTILLPELADGDYTLSITTQWPSGGGKLLKEPRSYVFPIQLTVDSDAGDDENPDDGGSPGTV